MNKKINNSLPVAREGLPFIFIGSCLTFFLFYFDLMFLAIIAGILTLFTIYFFRDPEREIGAHEKTILTPADGMVLDIRYLNDGNNPLGEPAIKVSIFMSIFNVHVNRIPIYSKISKIIYHPGKFFAANLDKASEQNESNMISLQTENGCNIIVIQIAGLIARRIACWIKEGDVVKAGQRFGLIRFGSRLDIYLPDNTRINVKVRQKVKAGVTIIGELP